MTAAKVCGREVVAAGLEPVQFHAGKAMVAHDGGAQSGTMPADLARVIEAWHGLPAETRAEIIRIIAQADATPRTTP